MAPKTRYKQQWDVESFTHPRKKPYKVSLNWNGEWECSCPAWTFRTPRKPCKHCLYVQKASIQQPTNPVFAFDTPILAGPALISAVFSGYSIRRRVLEEMDEIMGEVPIQQVARSL